MAYTKSLTVNSVFGDKRVQGYTVTADAASGTISTGLTIDHIGVAYGSITTANAAIYGVVRPNATAAGTASVGTIGFSGFTSGDVLYVTVYGH